MALLDVTDWPTGNQRWVPIGKRIKNVVLHPENFEMYYFKEPKTKYPWEFWTEVVASVIGEELGFKTLSYKPAILDGIAGCLSKSMTQSDNAELIHGQQYLIRIFPEFELKKGTDHTFELIEKFFNSDPRVIPLMDEFIEMLVFDAIIGNRDRHQQNWAIIREIKVLKSKKKLAIFFERKNKLPEFKLEIKFSPLFDNGNCLAYNIIEEDIEEYLENDEKLNKYLFGTKAVSHVRWQGYLLPHIELLIEIEKKYPEIINKSINRIKEKYDRDKISNLVNTIDNDVIFANESYNLSNKRKALMIKLIQTRTEKLLNSFQK